MASGRTHSIATILSAMCGVMQVPTNGAGAAWITGSIYGLLAQSDLDQIENIGEKIGGYYGQYIIRETFKSYRKIGSTIERIWWLYWQPYAKTFKHRSFWSHAPIVSTLGRLMYGLPYIIFFYLFLHDNFSYFVIALISSDTIHWLMDLKIWRKFEIFTQ